MENSRRKNLLIGAAALTWFLAIVIIYYVSHKPFSVDVLVNTAQLLWRLVAAFGIITAGGIIGAFFIKGDEQFPLIQMALQAGLGLGILSIIGLILGALIGVNWLLGILPFLISLIFLKKGLTFWRNLYSLKDLWNNSDGFGRTIGVLIGGLLLSALWIALAPPLWFDSLSTHLLLPQAYVNDGIVNYLPWQVMSGMPQNAEMLFMYAMLLAGGASATTVCWLLSVLSLLGVLGYLYQKLGSRPAWAGAAALTAGYSTVMLTASGYVEWLALLFGLGTLIFLDRWRQKPERVSLIVAGLFTGLAVGTKYTAGIVAVAGLGALIWHTWQRKQKLIPTALIYGASAVAAALPWFIKNWMTTGNPVYPFFFGGGAMTELRMEVWRNVPTYGNWLDIVALPLRATYLGLEGAGGYMVALGPILLGLGIFAWVGKDRRSPEQTASLQNAAWIAVIGILGWILGNQYSGRLIQTRYYFSLFPAFAVLVGYGFWGISRINISGLRIGRVLGVFIPLVLILNLTEVGMRSIQQDAFRAALGVVKEADYVANNLGWYQPAMWGIKDLGEGNRVLLLYEARGYYCAPTCVADEVLDRWKGDLDTYKTDEEIVQAWKNQGFTHVMAYTAGMEFLKTAGDPNHPPSDIMQLYDLLATLPTPVDYGNTYALYELH